MVRSPSNGALPSGQIISQICNRPLTGPQSIITLNSDNHTMWWSLSRMRPQYLVESFSEILFSGGAVLASIVVVPWLSSNGPNLSFCGIPPGASIGWVIDGVGRCVVTGSVAGDLRVVERFFHCLLLPFLLPFFGRFATLPRFGRFGRFHLFIRYKIINFTVKATFQSIRVKHGDLKSHGQIWSVKNFL